MSTENEGTPVPPAPSAPPVPVASPGASPQSPAPAGNTPPHHPAHAAPAGAPAAPQQPPAYGTPAPGPYDAPARAHAATGAPADGTVPGAPAGDPGAWPPPAPATPAYATNNAAGADGTGATGGAGGWGSGWGSPEPLQPAPKPAGRRGGLVAGILVAALVAGGIGGGIGYTLAKDNDGSSGSTTVSTSQSGGSFKRDAGSVAGVSAKALPSTVTIESEGTNGEGGTGTGFVFDTQGHIITNNHVVADAADGGKLTATFPNGKKYDAEIVGRAEGYDVAVIKLKNAPSNLKPLTLGDSDKVAVGDETIAIGAPFGLSNTVTTGIISAKDRPVASSDGTGSNASYMSALQTDASINPGNSGGPLIDAQGAVIGINSAIQSTSDSSAGGTTQSGSIGLGFAIPINQAKYVAQQLIKTGKPVYAKIGASVSLEDSTAGAKITDQGAGGSAAVEAGGPAAAAGLKSGDVITKLDNHVIDSGPTLIGEIWTHQPGDKVKITYKRDGQEHTVDLTLGSREGDS
ncbi:trypsin-like peptidase domain-containing protein [Streptomyces sp. NPDC008150]|uniref:S1C family serine protease n=1 Tax=Streptomyces sp. NPDC008150 TaxID=3364816 RepID=UPI0036E74CA8